MIPFCAFNHAATAIGPARMRAIMFGSATAIAESATTLNGRAGAHARCCAIHPRRHSLGAWPAIRRKARTNPGGVA